MSLQVAKALVTAAEWDDWRWQTRHRLRTLAELHEALGPSAPVLPPSEDVLQRFPVGVTPYYLSLADPADPSDPILRQVLPAEAEGRSRGQEVGDPFAEEERSPVQGVVHRYPDRALIVPTNFCATLCRHCFRKRTWADGFFMLDAAALRAAVDYVRRRPEVRDVLITGGDPLHQPVRRLRDLLADLRTIPHVEVLRVASRTPATLPQRIDAELLDVLAAARPLWFITHFNHAREVSPRAARALRDLLDRGISVQNQAVLLRGVNDSTAAQIDLARALLAQGVRPYYLHVADPVDGAGHFRLPLERARAIVRDMFGRISGLGIPRLVLDLPGGRGKVPVTPGFERRQDGATRWFESPIDGGEVEYLDPGAGD